MEDTFIDDLFKEYELPPNWLADCQGCDRTAPLKQQPFAKWLAPHFGNDDDLFIFTVYDSDGKAHVLINPYNPLEPEQEVVPGIEEKEAEKVQEVQEKVAENVEGHSQTEGKLTEEGLEHPAQQDPNKENEKEPSTDENRASFPARNDTLEDDWRGEHLTLSPPSNCLRRMGRLRRTNLASLEMVVTFFMLLNLQNRCRTTFGKTGRIVCHFPGRNHETERRVGRGESCCGETTNSNVQQYHCGTFQTVTAVDC